MSTGPLLRFVRPVPQFWGDDGRPSWRALQPNSGDEDDAAENAHPVRVSVWDLARCTARQAREISKVADAALFTITYRDVADAQEHWKMPSVRVVDDPLVDASAPGANGHCGIEGLEQQKPAEKPAAHRARLAFLTNRLLAYME